MKPFFLNHHRIYRGMLAIAKLLCLAGCKDTDKRVASLNRPDMDALKAYLKS